MSDTVLRECITGLSLLATGVVQRVIGAVMLVTVLWLAVLWALS